MYLSDRPVAHYSPGYNSSLGLLGCTPDQLRCNCVKIMGFGQLGFRNHKKTELECSGETKLHNGDVYLSDRPIAHYSPGYISTQPLYHLPLVGYQLSYHATYEKSLRLKGYPTNTGTPKRMNFRKSSKRPLTPLLIFGKSYCGFRDKIATKVRIFIMAGLLCII